MILDLDLRHLRVLHHPSGRIDEESEIQTKSEPLKKKEDMSNGGKGKFNSQPSRSSEVKCFKYMER